MIGGREMWMKREGQNGVRKEMRKVGDKDEYIIVRCMDVVSTKIPLYSIKIFVKTCIVNLLYNTLLSVMYIYHE